MIVMLRTFQQMKSNESWDAIEMAVAGQPDLLEVVLRPFLTLNRFIAMNMTPSFAAGVTLAPRFSRGRALAFQALNAYFWCVSRNFK
jgi:hypothetical protein